MFSEHSVVVGSLSLAISPQPASATAWPHRLNEYRGPNLPVRQPNKPPAQSMFTGLVETKGIIVGRGRSAPGASIDDSRRHRRRRCLDRRQYLHQRLLPDRGSDRRGAARFRGGGRDPVSHQPGTLAGRFVSVNLERSLAVGDRLGGHYVTGHVDSLGIVDRASRRPPMGSSPFSNAASLASQVAAKGSIAVDGVSSNGRGRRRRLVFRCSDPAYARGHDAG